MEKAERTDPTDPMDSADPTDPMDSTEPLDPMLNKESSDHNDHRDPEPLPVRIVPTITIPPPLAGP